MTEEYISFPKLNMTFQIDRVAFSIGDKNIYWYGIIIAFGFLLAVVCAFYLAKKYNMKQDTIVDIVLIAAPCAIVSARLYYVLFRWDYYSVNPDEIIKIWNGGLAIYGAIIASVIVAAIYCRLKKENLALFCDIGAIGLLIGQSIGRWGNFVNQEAFGTNTNLPWGMTGSKIKEDLYSLAAKGIDVDPNIPVHPTFLYESLWNALFLVVFLCFFKKRRFDGQIFLCYIISYGVGRFFIESLRLDSLYIGEFRVSQLVALACIALGIAGMAYKILSLKKKE